MSRTTSSDSQQAQVQLGNEGGLIPRARSYMENDISQDVQVLRLCS